MRISGWGSGSTKKYSHSGYGISLEYPRTWKKKEGDKGLVVMFLAPKDAGSGMFQANLNVTVQSLTEAEADLDSYVQSMTKKEREMIPEYHLETVEEAELAQNPARRIVFTSKQGHVTVKVVQLSTIVSTLTGPKAYAVTFAAEESRFDELWPAAEGIIKSFTISS